MTPKRAAKVVRESSKHEAGDPALILSIELERLVELGSTQGGGRRHDAAYAKAIELIREMGGRADG